MATLFEDICDTIYKATSAIAKAGTEFASHTQLTFDIVSVKSDLEKKHTQLGKLICDANNGKPAAEGEIKALMEEIDELQKRLDDLNEKDAGISGKKICPGCNATICKENAFCQKCGHKFD